MDLTDVLGKYVEVTIDRPIGSVHPKHSNIIYPINYGYVKGIIAEDGEEQDVYVLGCNHPIEKCSGNVIAVIHRLNDVEDKWVITLDEKEYTEEEIRSITHFQEQYYISEIYVR